MAQFRYKCSDSKSISFIHGMKLPACRREQTCADFKFSIRRETV